MRFSAFVLGLLMLSGAIAQDNNGGGDGEVQNGNGNDGGNNNGGGGGGGGNGGGNNNGNNNSDNQPSASASRNGGGNNNGGASATSAVNSRPSGNATSTLPPGAVVTTITSVLNSGSTTATFAFTLTVGPQPNATVDGNGFLNGTLNGTDIYGNGTNGTMNETQPWNDTLGYLPFTPKLDPAYGVAGALMILTGVPVATLGGKNRWSALAIISGYSVALFSLVMILSFG